MKQVHFLFLFQFLGLHLLFAQNPGEVFIQQAGFNHNEAVFQFTGDFTTSLSGLMDFDSFDELDTDSNVASVNQIGDGNISTLTQNGIGNMVRINTLGNRNTTGLEQNGFNNRFILNLEGNDNQIKGAQIGTGNQLRIDLIGSGLPTQIFTQTGNNLSLQLFDSGSGGIPMQIEQRGNRASVIIENY